MMVTFFQTAVQPGLRLLLEGQSEASPSAFSLDGAARITPIGSLRRRQKSPPKQASQTDLGSWVRGWMCTYMYTYMCIYTSVTLYF